MYSPWFTCCRTAPPFCLWFYPRPPSLPRRLLPAHSIYLIRLPFFTSTPSYHARQRQQSPTQLLDVRTRTNASANCFITMPSSSSLLGLRRSKSTSSVSHTSHHASTLIDDPLVASAHQQALAAASHAFGRPARSRENLRPAADRLANRGSMDVILEKSPAIVVDTAPSLRRSNSQRTVGTGMPDRVLVAQYPNHQIQIMVFVDLVPFGVRCAKKSLVC
jgi:hypothetical protein